MRILRFPNASEREASLQRMIDLLLVVIAALLAERGDTPLRFTEEQRRTIATHAHAVGWRDAGRLLVGVCALSTVRGWFTHLVQRVARNRQRPPPGNRIPTRKRKLVRRFAIDNPTWGYDKIADAVNGLGGRPISDQSVGNILKEYGIPPAGERGARRRRWRHFITAH